jgi:transposase
MPGAFVPFYLAPDHDVHPAAAASAAACRCCPGGLSRSTRARRYPSDMTEAEWAVCEPLLPAPAWLAGRGGRPASWCMRDIVDAIRYLTHNGPVWRARPADFPPAGTVYWWADKWQADGSAERMTMTCANGFAPQPGARAPPQQRSSIPSR